MCTQLCLMPEHFASHICDSFVCKKAPWRARLYDWDPPLTSPSGKSHCGYHYCKGPSEMAFGATQTLLPPMVKSMVLIPAFCSGTGGECWGRARVEGSAFLSGVTQIKTVMKRHVRSQYEAYSWNTWSKSPPGLGIRFIPGLVKTITIKKMSESITDKTKDTDDLKNTNNQLI